jgi:hypothetical protein
MISVLVRRTKTIPRRQHRCALLSGLFPIPEMQKQTTISRMSEENDLPRIPPDLPLLKTQVPSKSPQSQNLGVLG